MPAMIRRVDRVRAGDRIPPETTMAKGNQKPKKNVKKPKQDKAPKK